MVITKLIKRGRFSTKYGERNGHMSDLSAFMSCNRVVIEIKDRFRGYKILTTLDQEEINGLAQFLDKHRDDGKWQ